MIEEKIVIHMSGAYRDMTFYKTCDWMEIDCRDIEGTNCYCDDAAKEELRRRFLPFSYEGLHFLDSGNYHYLSLFWLEKIKEPFSLVLFDHPSRFAGGFLWRNYILRRLGEEALLTNEYLQMVYLVGVDEKLIQEVRRQDMDSPSPDGALWSKVKRGLPDFSQEKNPVYISFDKDVLRREDAVCDWDQGDMSISQALESLDFIKKNAKEILGMDVCGEDAKWIYSGDEETLLVNDACNKALTCIAPKE